MRGFFYKQGDGRGEYSPLSQVVVESVSNNDALFPSDLLDEFKKIILDYDVDSLGRLNAWHQEAPELVRHLKTPIDQFVTPYLENYPNVKSLVEDSERKQSQEENTLEALVNTVLEKLENSPAASLSQEIQFLQSILNRASLDELSEIKSELADTQDFIALYNEQEFSNYIDFIDSLILKRLVQKTLENAHFVDKENKSKIPSAPQSQSGVLTSIDQQVRAATQLSEELTEASGRSISKVQLCVLAVALCEAASIISGGLLVKDGNRSGNSDEKNLGFSLMIVPTLLSFFAFLGCVLSACLREERARDARGQQRFFVAASAAVQTLEQKSEEQKSPRNG